MVWGGFNRQNKNSSDDLSDAERRFKNMETQTKRILEEARRYGSAVQGMLSHQIAFSNAIAELYKPISGRVNLSHAPEGNQEGIEACEQYASIVRELQELLAPELEMIQTRVVKPTEEMVQIMRMIHKTTQKRNKKKSEYDKKASALKKLQEKRDRTMKDEKAMYQAEVALEQITQEFEFINTTLKDDLPRVFQLEAGFIEPLFATLYYIQLNIFYTIQERMGNLDIGYFDLSGDIEGVFREKRGDVQERAEELGITRFKGKTTAQLTHQTGRRSSIAQTSASQSSASQSSTVQPAGLRTNPGIKTNPGYTTVSHVQPLARQPPAIPPKPPTLHAPEYVTALYDYTAQSSGDLTIHVGDKIEVVNRSDNPNEWWTGRLNGQQGLFPGNYVQL